MTTLITKADRDSAKDVLLVDHSDENARSVGEIFSLAGLADKLRRVASPSAAIYSLVAGARPAVVLLNPKENELTGAKLVRELRSARAFSNVPIVVFVRSKTLILPTDPMELADSYIGKPLRISSLISCWRYWTEIRGLPRL